jgi:V/A-type H+-transporting ATPase subunit I
MAYLHQTGMCFFIHGWTPEAEVARLTSGIAKFRGEVVEKRQVLEQDLDLCRLPAQSPVFPSVRAVRPTLPLPRYASLDPTPFIAICFPLFFGMILGDAGRIILLASPWCWRGCSETEHRADMAKILLISSCYTILFGIFTASFSAMPGRGFWLGRGLDRRTAGGHCPDALLALSVGLAHILSGWSGGSLRPEESDRREALYKLATIVVILCLLALFLSYQEFLPASPNR